ncbi:MULTISPECIES: ATP-dependent zinc metalloprotease FtsH [unclassified Mesorhizobium]|uniref:ATP-dependent zinc metalloprotease FtsH n=1 Tax=unclassified Mesorhizobium TaxID=325217 RepID=UPI000FCADAF5|nr:MULTISPECIES: ATP-dependent zinc metalloprotease FtsH [unclassified Mesorhizobium]RUV55360.1 ATP-dependent metallopeptidase FtsH/Yme1/Tma family protein [Mesorhizobium sp. M5C.F.Ca.IN.020.29.1.1]RWI18588.1 MAG: ATP-dependent metallopeptidase FtsH/Yme1/Tma family protein [Mesorhizobium sp.]RWK46286.1 MAG: ATP-dependent metallopeptidase FtsH/Yme1/Tma family protein [Mesorhizobium sp.]RWK53591.1 MAG: ATP-dependent metallopeptidase FtsH/Yme1/Tma family protein [Mesorhizobium sp.]RWK93922.1 MAG:
MDRKHTFNIGYVIVAFLIIELFQVWFAYRDTAHISYSDVIRLTEEGKVASVTLTETMIEGAFKEPLDGKTTFLANRVDPAAVAVFEKAGVKITGASDSNWLTTILSWILPALIFVGIWTFFFRGFADRQGMGGLINIGKSKAKVYLERKTGVTFEDVAGVDEAKAELQEIVSFLKDKDRYGRLGARIPKGILLVGPPGTGKTLMARAVAGEAGVPFFSISGSEFVEMFVGVGAARVRDLFEQARQAAPCIIFIDELDALGRARSPFAGYGGGDEKEQTLNQLLSELDGFDPRVGIVLLAATNRPEILDPALLRAGRFDRQVVLDRPDRKGREAIVKVHIKNVSIAPGVSTDEIAAITPGFSGADLANLVNEAAIIATRRGADKVTMDDFTNAVERIVAGSERKSRLLKPQERERVAFHEMGHALVAVARRSADPVHKVSIIPRSIGALGFTMQRPTEDRFLITVSELKDRMVVLMGGRAAEEIIFGEVSTGAADDLAKVTDIARQCVTRFGMDPTVGQAVLEEQRLQWLGDGPGLPNKKDYSEATAREVDLAVRGMIEEAFASAKDVLRARITDLRAGAKLLLEKETLTPDDFAPLRRTAELAPAT